MKNRILIFPEDIDYKQAGYSNLINDQVDERIRTILVERGFGNSIIGFNKLSELENYLFSKITSIKNDDEIKDEELIDIFHKIQFWGGGEGRYIYVQDGGFKKNFNIGVYRKLVSKCLNLEKHMLLDWINSVSHWAFQCNEGINRFNTSFSTKHIRFWLYKKLQDNTLPILDEVIRKGFKSIEGNNINTNNRENLEFYWKQMTIKSEKENLSLNQLERLLFNHWR